MTKVISDAHAEARDRLKLHIDGTQASSNILIRDIQMPYDLESVAREGWRSTRAAVSG